MVVGATVVGGAVVGAVVVTLGRVVLDNFGLVVDVLGALELSSFELLDAEATDRIPKRRPKETTTAVAIHFVLAGHCRFVQIRAIPIGAQRKQLKLTRVAFSYHCGGR